MSLFFLLWLLLLARMAYLQLFPNQKLANLNRLRLERSIELAGERGSVLDRHGNQLAFSIRAYSLVADPFLIKDISKTVKTLNQALTTTLRLNSSFLSHLSKKLYKGKKQRKRFVWLVRDIDNDKKSQLEKLTKKYKLTGIYFIKDWKRIYIYPQLFSPLLGFTSKDGRGQEGLEYHWEKTLKSSKKRLRVKQDAKGRSLFSEELLFNDLNRGGHHIQLTLDSDTQSFLQKELKKAVQLHSAESALGLILDAKTAAVRAMSTVLKKRPRLASSKRSPFYHKNKIVTDAFEPGSTMKTFVFATLLREGFLSDLNKKYYCEGGKWKLPTYEIKEAHLDFKKQEWNWLTLKEILAKSSNVCTSKLAFSVGADAHYQVLKDFGFGEKTGIDFPGETKGILHTPPWTPYQLSHIGFGHNITTSPLQIARAYVAIANGGILMQPYLLKSIFVQHSDFMNLSSGPYPLRRVLKEEHAALLKKLLQGVVSKSGTGYRATVLSHPAGGKTGTAQKVNSKKGGYYSKKYISSFVGFAPLKDPKYVVYIAVDSPKKNYYASYVAAPIFSKVTSYLLRRGTTTRSQRSLASIEQLQPFLKKKQQRQAYNQIPIQTQTPPPTPTPTPTYKQKSL